MINGFYFVNLVQLCQREYHRSHKDKVDGKRNTTDINRCERDTYINR